MNLISCKQCGVALDLDAMDVPKLQDIEERFFEDCTEWNGERYAIKVSCPVCDGDVLV